MSYDISLDVECHLWFLSRNSHNSLSYYGSYLSYLLMIHRIMKYIVSDYTNIIRLRQPLNLNRGLFVPPRGWTKYSKLTPHMTKLLIIQQSLTDIVIFFLPIILLLVTIRTDSNSYVLVQWHADTPTCLHTKWKGPLRVISENRSTYLLLDLITNKQKSY